MTDNIKLPPYPEGLCLREDIEDYAREAVRLNAQGVPDEPNWRHPKIQGLIGSEARLRITIDLIWKILEDPNQEFTASDMEYWDTIHDKLKAALSAARTNKGAVMTNTTPSGADVLQEGSTVYALNARGANRWWASVYPGQDDEGKRTSDDECKQIAHAIRAALAAAQAVPDGYTLVPVDAMKRWRDAFAEELSAWDISPPLHHVQTSHDEIEAILAAPAAQGEPSDPLQGAANWLLEAIEGCNNSILQWHLKIGPNRAERLMRAARAAQQKGASND